MKYILIFSRFKFNLFIIDKRRTCVMTEQFNLRDEIECFEQVQTSIFAEIKWMSSIFFFSWYVKHWLRNFQCAYIIIWKTHCIFFIFRQSQDNGMITSLHQLNIKEGFHWFLITWLIWWFLIHNNSDCLLQ